MSPLLTHSPRSRKRTSARLHHPQAHSLRALVRALLLAIGSVASGPVSASALPLISEVLYDAVGSDNARSFVEIYAPPGTSLDGLVLKGVNGSGGAIGPTIALAGTVPADGLFVVADRDSAGATQVANFDLLANFDFQNGYQNRASSRT